MTHCHITRNILFFIKRKHARERGKPTYVHVFRRARGKRENGFSARKYGERSLKNYFNIDRKLISPQRFPFSFDIYFFSRRIFSRIQLRDFILGGMPKRGRAFCFFEDAARHAYIIRRALDLFYGRVFQVRKLFRSGKTTRLRRAFVRKVSSRGVKTISRFSHGSVCIA